MDMTKKAYVNKTYTVTRISRKALARIRNLAAEYGTSVPAMLDKMLEYFEMVKPVIDMREKSDEG